MTAPTLLLTRPAPQAADWLERLGREGVAARSLPLIEIAPAESPAEALAAWKALDDGVALAVFVSPNAVEQFFALRPKAPWPSATLAACIGPGSARALGAAGVPEALIVQPAADAASLDSEHLWAELADHDWQGRQVIFLRGLGGREWLAERLQEAGAQTRAFGVYQRRCPSLRPGEQVLLEQALARPSDWVWLFSSAEALGHLRTLVGPQSLAAHRALCTHPRIAEACRAQGMERVVLARPDPADVARVLRSL